MADRTGSATTAPALFAIIAGSILVLVKGADLLVDQAVALSMRWGVPTMLIGATIVSIGTTLPEASVSVFAALQGAPGLAPRQRGRLDHRRYRADPRSGHP